MREAGGEEEIFYPSQWSNPTPSCLRVQNSGISLQSVIFSVTFPFLVPQTWSGHPTDYLSILRGRRLR